MDWIIWLIRFSAVNSRCRWMAAAIVWDGHPLSCAVSPPRLAHRRSSFGAFHNARQWMQFGFDENYPEVAQEHFAARYEASGGANSVFNASLYISVHRGQAVHTIFKNEYFVLSPDNTIHREPVVDRRNDLLIDIFRLSPEMAKKIPADLAS